MAESDTRCEVIPAFIGATMNLRVVHALEQRTRKLAPAPRIDHADDAAHSDFDSSVSGAERLEYAQRRCHDRIGLMDSRIQHAIARLRGPTLDMHGTRWDLSEPDFGRRDRGAVWQAQH
jgi:hypothetical protein